MSKSNKPGKFIWHFYTNICKLMMKFTNPKGEISNTEFKNRDKTSGALVIFNHCSNYDHIALTSAFHYDPVNYVIARYFNYKKLVSLGINAIKTIKREQFKPDVASIKQIKKVLNEKGVVAISPAGQVSIHGDLPYIDKAIVKLVKFANVDVFTAKLKGTYLKRPKWTKKNSSATINVEIVKTLSRDDLKSLTDQEIYEKIVSSINVYDYQLQTISPQIVKKKNKAVGLEKFIYICPKCMQKYTFRTYDNHLTCTNCGNDIVYDQYNFFKGNSQEYMMFQNEKEWYEFEKRKIREDILANNLHLESDFYLYSNPSGKWKIENVGSGKLVLTNDKFYYEGTYQNKPIIKEFNLPSLVQLPFAAGKHFEVHDDDFVFKFIPINNKNQVVEWVQAIDVLQELKTGR